MAKPKLALIPAAQGDKFYSVLPSDGVGDFTFARASTGTRIAPTGLIEEVASGDSRLNYDLLNGKVVNCPHYLLEPASTNVIPYSEDFSQSTGWESSGKPSVESNVIISPDGTLNATRLSFGSNNSLRVKPELTFTNDYSYSIFVKKDIGSFVTIYCAFFTTSIIVGFDLDNGTCQTGGVIEKYGNDWYRLSVSKNVTGDADKSGYFYLYSTQTLGSTTSVSGNKLYVWGAQVEDSGYPTSYIPNYGNAAGVTRSAETANGSGDAATFNDSEGVLMAQIEVNEDSINKRISLSNSSTSQRIVLWFNANNTTINVFINGGETVNILYVVGNLQEQNKYAFKYKENDCSLWINGIEVATDITATMPSGLSELAFDDGGGGLPFYGKTKQIQYFDSALTDAQLETLTSWTSLQEMITSQLYTNY